MIYADNAATTRLDSDAFEAMKPFLLGEYANASQPYSFSRAAKNALNQARQTIASCINALPEEIFFTSGGTESDNWVIKGSAFADVQKRATITSAIEHHAILHSCASIERLGYPVSYIIPNDEGTVEPGSLRNIITDNTRMVSIMFANNEIGSIQPIKELCDIAHTYGAWFHTDAVQAVGHINVDVKELGVDMLSASAHKFNGPKGIGFLYIRRGVNMDPYVDGGAQERQMRAGTENIAAIVGMASALKTNCDALIENQRYMRSLEDQLLWELSTKGIPFTHNGGFNTLPGLLSLSFLGRDGEAILHRMDLSGVCISTGSACNGESTEISHVLKAIRLPDELSKGTIRISLGKDNTEEEMRGIYEALIKCIKC